MAIFSIHWAVNFFWSECTSSHLTVLQFVIFTISRAKKPCESSLALVYKSTEVCYCISSRTFQEKALLGGKYVRNCGAAALMRRTWLGSSTRLFFPLLFFPQVHFDSTQSTLFFCFVLFAPPSKMKLSNISWSLCMYRHFSCAYCSVALLYASLVFCW